MNFILKALLFLLLVIIITVLYPVLVICIPIAIIYLCFTTASPTELPKITNGWYGRKKLEKSEFIPEDDPTIHKFVVNVADSVLDDLRVRLSLARFAEPIDGTDFRDGFNGDYLKEVVDYWRKTYDWRQQEIKLNKYDHYRTQIEGIFVHYIHVRADPSAQTVLPLMVVHGWPGSVLEYYKSFPLLTQSIDGVAFEVICPSIPGFGFSEEPHQKGFTVASTARIFVKLMNRLGHKLFFIHGGDWGSAISRMAALLYPQNILGMHTTFDTMMPLRGTALLKLIVGMFAPSLVFDDPVNDYHKIFPLSKTLKFLFRETGYFHIQATKPETLGASLIDSPVGLAAYILEKFSVATDRSFVHRFDGGITQKFTLDELLTNVMLYWLSDNVAASLRYYKENFVNVISKPEYSRFAVRNRVPAAVADFPNEVLRLPKVFKHYQYENLVQFTEMPRGGHFSAFEEPELLTDDIRKFAVTVIKMQ